LSRVHFAGKSALSETKRAEIRQIRIPVHAIRGYVSRVANSE
jgi:hypothetical protein